MSRERASAHPVITSAANPQIKMMRSLGRRKVRHTERAFLVEGRRLVEDALQHGASIRSLLVREDQPESWVASLGIDPQRVRFVSGNVFDDASEVEHSQGVAAICDFPERTVTVADLVTSGELVLVLDRVRDPGNMGTALRSAAAAGVGTVLVGHGSVDPMAPKVVRAGMGAHFRLDIAHISTELIGALQSTGRDIVYADASATMSYHELPWNEACALIVGGETEPLSPDLEQVVTRYVSIPMHADVESLNAGVAASVLLFEAMWRRTS